MVRKLEERVGTLMDMVGALGTPEERIGRLERVSAARSHILPSDTPPSVLGGSTFGQWK